jgi:uncharacterized protein YndB with AHSA1/START domain
MNQTTSGQETAAAQQPAPLKISRIFHASPEIVFEAWSSAERVMRWFSPKMFTVPHAKVEMHVGGAFEICMRAPDGTQHWTRGTFVEVTPPRRLVIDMHATDSTGKALFRAYTEVDFTEALGGTRMDVVQTYTFIEPEIAAPMVGGAPEGWNMTLDKLEQEVVRMRGGTDTGTRSIAHGTFTLQRTYDAPATLVWTALTEADAKQKWFAGTPGEWELLERHMDVRPGGKERLKGRWKGGVISTFDAIYHDVIPQERLIYSYEMHLDDKKISVSLATMELKAEGAKTTLKVTEHGAFLDGFDDAGSREHGTGHLLDALGKSLSDGEATGVMCERANE